MFQYLFPQVSLSELEPEDMAPPINGASLDPELSEHTWLQTIEHKKRAEALNLLDI